MNFSSYVTDFILNRRVYMNFENLIKQDPQVNEILERELLRQQRNIELIASEKHSVKSGYGSYGKLFYKQVC